MGCEPINNMIDAHLVLRTRIWINVLIFGSKKIAMCWSKISFVTKKMQH